MSAIPPCPKNALTALPMHEPCGLDGAGVPSFEAGLAIRCETIRSFARDGDGYGWHDRRGCGALFVLCDHGQRGPASNPCSIHPGAHGSSPP
jgi:hypothetical protein